MVCAQRAEIPAMVVSPVIVIGFQRSRVIRTAFSAMDSLDPEAFSSWYLAIIWMP